MGKEFSERARLADKIEGPREPIIEITPPTKSRRSLKDYWILLYYFFLLVGAYEMGRHFSGTKSVWYSWFVVVGGFLLFLYIPEFISSRLEK